MMAFVRGIRCRGRRPRPVIGIEGRSPRLLPLLPSGPDGFSNSRPPSPTTGYGRFTGAFGKDRQNSATVPDCFHSRQDPGKNNPAFFTRRVRND